MYRIVLQSVGNPDFGQDPDQPMSPPEIVIVDTLRAASEAARAYIQRHHLGSGNFPSPRVVKDGRVVARISYNGRIWLPPDGACDPSDGGPWREAPE